MRPKGWMARYPGFNWQRGILNLMGPTPGDVFTTNAYNTSSLRIIAGFSF